MTLSTFSYESDNDTIQQYKNQQQAIEKEKTKYMSNKIIEITPEQQKLLERTRDEWLVRGRSVELIDKISCAQTIFKIYEEIGEDKPEIQFYESPRACLLAYSKILKKQNPKISNSDLQNKLREQLSNFFVGNLWCYWEVFYNFCREIGVKYTDQQNKKLDIWMDQARYCHWWFPYKGIVLASDFPSVLKIDEAGRLHNLTGPALQYRDGYAIYSVNGLRVPEDIIMNPASITVKRIEAETNVELRRVMIGLFSQERYILESNAKIVHQDDYGTLYIKDVKDDEPIMMVKVVNSTQEADGSFRDYFIRVDPKAYKGLKTARAAVASTWRSKKDRKKLAFDRPEDYDPYIET